jgi:serine/threonine protein kinase
MPAGRAAAFVSPVASALDTAHEAGLVHRDVKPANMLVDVGRGRPEHVYLSDFGLARGVDTGGLSAGDLTTPGQFMGTPEYAAPEQITGGEVDGRADQYALGCVAYTLLTGSVPYPREQAIAVMYAQLYDPPPLVTATRRDLPLSVNQVLARAMEKKPDDRYDNCMAFADALREALDLPGWGSEGVRAAPRGGTGGPVSRGYSQTQLAPHRPGREAVQPPPSSPTSYESRPGTWTAVVAADRSYYNGVWANDVPPEEIIPFPEDSPVRHFPLSGTELLIGRRSASRGIHPEIDLTLPPGGPLTDTGVSREHAKLVARPDGSWAIIDLGTENGTLVNEREIQANVPTRLRNGDRINQGMWTVITITRD